MASIPDDYHDLFEKRTIAHLATLDADGRPHVTPVWVDYDPDADRLLVNTARGRRKARNLERDPTVSASMTDPGDDYRFLSVQGEVDELREEGAVAHIDELARRYMDVDEYPNKGEEEGARVIVSIRPESVLTG